ncbi:MAG TPA: M15 family metallopeptidase [Gaiellaceae bacterium]|nr:M15 family metallopeptidase [Gaiellaceae bacterium]
MIRLAIVPLVALTVASFHSTIRPLSAPVRAELKSAGVWHQGCPVSLAQLRVLTVTHWGFDNRTHTGQLVVNADSAAPLARVFKRLYELRFPIRHLRLGDAYGPVRTHPADNDISGSFECRQAVASPCTSTVRKGTGSWSEHAYGRAVDVNPVENPYVGCGMSRDPRSRRYLDRTRLRRGMVTPAVVAAFRSIGWGWGGSWSGATKDYMHFSASGH